MSRLRYPAVVGAVGSGGMTSGATTHTFTVPLVYGNATTLPTLTGLDYFMLSIFDSTGALTEIVQVTAYNQSTGVSTIVRGQEGTTGVSHTAGDKVTQGIYASDWPNTPTIDSSTSQVTANTGTTPLTLTIPGTAVAGDLLVGLTAGAGVFSGITGATVSADGWINDKTITGTNIQGGISYAVATGASAGTTLTVGYGSAFFATAALVVVRGWQSLCGSSIAQTGTSVALLGAVLPGANRFGTLVLGYTALRVANTLVAGNLANTQLTRSTDASIASGVFWEANPAPLFRYIGSTPTNGALLSAAVVIGG